MYLVHKERVLDKLIFLEVVYLETVLGAQTTQNVYLRANVLTIPHNPQETPATVQSNPHFCRPAVSVSLGLPHSRSRSFD